MEGERGRERVGGGVAGESEALTAASSSLSPSSTCRRSAQVPPPLRAGSSSDTAWPLSCPPRQLSRSAPDSDGRLPRLGPLCSSACSGQ